MKLIQKGRCIKLLFEEHGAALMGYSAYTDSNAVMWCFPWKMSDSVEFVAEGETVRILNLIPVILSHLISYQ